MIATVLQIGLPGTQEMLIVLLILFVFAIPAGVVALLVIFLVRRGSGGDDDRIEELEREVEELQEQTQTNEPVSGEQE